MRINQIITEAELQGELNADLEDLLASALANGVKKVSAQKLASSLLNMGYQVSPESLLPILDSIPLVKEVSGYIVILSTNDVPAESPNRVNKMARNLSMASIKR